MMTDDAVQALIDYCRVKALQEATASDAVWCLRCDGQGSAFNVWKFRFGQCALCHGYKKISPKVAKQEAERQQAAQALDVLEQRARSCPPKGR